MSYATGSRRLRGTNPRARGTNPRAVGTSARCLATNATAGTARDTRRVASTIAHATAVAVWRGDTAPTSSRAATMYLAANRMAGGPKPVRTPSPYGAWWSVPAWEGARCELASQFGYARRPCGPLGETTAAELAGVEPGGVVEPDGGEPP